MNRTGNEGNKSQIWCADLPFHSLRPLTQAEREALSAEARRLRVGAWLLVSFLPICLAGLLIAGYFSPAIAYVNAWFVSLFGGTYLFLLPIMLWGPDSPVRRSQMLRADLKYGSFRRFQGSLPRIPCNYLTWPRETYADTYDEALSSADKIAFSLRGPISHRHGLSNYYEAGGDFQNSLLLGGVSSRLYYINDCAIVSWKDARITSEASPASRRSSQAQPAGGCTARGTPDNREPPLLRPE